ncbi:hypothetical protein GOARA_074_00010, partial [Gordonia araii NBRC 100433]
MTTASACDDQKTNGEIALPDSPLELLRLVDAAQAKLTSAVWPAVTEDDLLTAARLIERSRCRAEGVAAQLFAEINIRDAHTRDGFTHPMTWLAKGLRLGRSEAKKRYRRAEKIARLNAASGETLAPKHPATAAAVADGAIAGQHVDVIREIMGKLPWSLPDDVESQAEADLAAMARELTPQELHKAGLALLAYLDPDGSLSDERDRARRRGLTLSPQGTDLMSHLTADLPPIVRAKLDLFLANWAAPGMNNPDDTNAERLDGPLAAHDTDDQVAQESLSGARARDHRTPEQRNIDAFEAMLDATLANSATGARAANIGHASTRSSKRKTIPGQFIVTATIADLKAGCGLGLTTTGTLIPIRELVNAAAHLDPNLIVFADHTREILYHGRAKRSATFHQRLALFARDRGDTHPDSDTPFIHTQAHHLPDWAQGGTTDIDKLTATSGP